jgi:hypothetical protein
MDTSITPPQQLQKRLPIARLLLPNITDSDVNQDVYNIDPRLSLADDQINALARRTGKQCWPPYTIPDFTPNPTTWPSTDAYMDTLWDNLVQDTKTVLDQLQPGSLPTEMSSDIRHLVKPVGSLDQPLLMLSSYPTMTTVQKEYGVIHDPSNPSMGILYMKLGLGQPGALNGVLHIDETLLRIERSTAEDAYERGFYKRDSAQVPKILRQVWDQYQFSLVHKSKATVGLAIGRHSTHTVLRYLYTYKIEFDAIFEDGTTSTQVKRFMDMQPTGGIPPLAIKQYMEGTNRTRLSRIWYCGRHPEKYSRFRSHSFEESSHLYHDLLRERLLDMGTLLAYGHAPPRPAFLSTMQYFTDPSSGTVIPLKVLEDLDLSNKDAIAAIFAKPNINLIPNVQKNP